MRTLVPKSLWSCLSQPILGSTRAEHRAMLGLALEERVKHLDKAVHQAHDWLCSNPLPSDPILWAHPSDPLNPFSVSHGAFSTSVHMPPQTRPVYQHPPPLPKHALKKPSKPASAKAQPATRRAPKNSERPSIRPPSLLQHLKQGFDIVFPQELRKKPLLPHISNQKGHRAVIFSNLSPHQEHGAGLAFSPLLSQFVTPCDNPDKDGLITAALLTLPGAPPLLVASVYAPAGEVWRRKVETSLRPLLKQIPSFLLGGDFNCLIHPSLDRQGLLSDNHWPWIRHLAKATRPLLGDTYCLANPTTREFTRYPQGHRTSSSRLDYIFISPASLEKMSLLDASIHSENHATDHHPSSCTLSVPPTPFHSSTVTKRVFRKLNKSEISTSNDALKEMSDWCQSFTPLITNTPLATVQRNTPMVIRELSAQYHNTTAARINPYFRAVKSIRQALNDVPPPTHPQFSARMAQLNDAIHQWDDTYNKSKRSKIHRCLIQKTNIKKTLNEAANPTEHRAASLKDPNRGKLTCDTKRLTEIFSDPLLTLGGPLNYEPSAHTAEELLQHTPQCPPSNAITPTPEITRHSFISYLHSCKPSKAGGVDSKNGYLLHISPEPVKQFLPSVCNLHPTNDMPDEWLEAIVVLLYKKGQTHNPVNYRPITLLNTLYKIVATGAAKHLYEISSFYGLIHKTQFRGLPNRRCSDHIFQLLAKYQNCPASYILYIDFNKAFKSVPHGSLFQTLEHYRLPSPLIRLI